MGAKDTFFYRNNTLKCGEMLLDLGIPVVMGIINVTPDSFFGYSRAKEEKELLEKAEKIISEGGTIIDIGAESTRPGAQFISQEEELKRLIPSINLIRHHFPKVIISADTSKAKVAKEAAQAGANIINDISGGNFDPEMFKTIAALKVPYVLMHTKEKPLTMQQNPTYQNLFEEISLYFAEKIKTLKEIGISDIILDPGFGFAKTTEHNYELLNKLVNFKIFGLPVLVGVSRKRMINQVIGTTPDTALNGTTVIHTMALEKGASILRVHDVKEAVEAVKIVTFAKNTLR
jgi:dihydropteroate synthase